MRKLTIIMVVIGLLLTMLFALPGSARAQADTAIRLTTHAEGVVYEDHPIGESDSKSDSAGWSLAPPLIESEVTFRDRSHGLGAHALVPSSNYPAVAKARAENKTILDLEAQVAAIDSAHSRLTARAGVETRFTNNKGYDSTAEFWFKLSPSQLLTRGYCTTGPGAPTAVYNVELRIFWPDGQSDVIFQTSEVLVGGTKDHNLSTSSTSGDELEATPFIPLPGLVGYEFDGLERNYDLGILKPGESLTAVFQVYMSAEGGGAEACSTYPPWPPTWFTYHYWGAGAFMDGPFDNISLAADFYASPIDGVAPLTVSFADRSTGYITSWAWNFGDGSTSTERNPTHTYADPDTYTVTLTVTDSAGLDTEIKSDYVNVNERPRKAMPLIPLLLLDE